MKALSTHTVIFEGFSMLGRLVTFRELCRPLGGAGQKLKTSNSAKYGPSCFYDKFNEDEMLLLASGSCSKDSCCFPMDFADESADNCGTALFSASRAFYDLEEILSGGSCLKASHVSIFCRRSPCRASAQTMILAREAP